MELFVHHKAKKLVFANINTKILCTCYSLYFFNKKMSLEGIFEPSLGSNFSINTPKSSNNANFISLSYLSSADAVCCKQPYCLTQTFGSFHSSSARQSHFLTTSSSILPPPFLSFTLINTHPTTNTNKNSIDYDI